MIFKSYNELIELQTFEERYNYLKLDSSIGEETFGSKRYLNQEFYHSGEWRRFKDHIITRDNGCDLGIIGFEIVEKAIIYIHHINPLSIEDVINDTSILLDPNNAITTILSTHNAIHYGTPYSSLKIRHYTPRSPADTCPWKNKN